jgi:molybdopterin converting factor small subunit
VTKLKKEVASLEELKEKLIREYSEQKFNLNPEVEKELHNKLSIIFNYQFKNENQNQFHQILLYNFLSSIMVKDFILDIIHQANKYLSEKYEIDDLKFEELNNKALIDNFQKKTSKIRNGIDEQLIKWISYELIEQAEFMDSTIFVN